MKLAVASVFTAFVALASAFTPPDYNKPPSGNAILKPGLNEQVPVGVPYKITWDPTTTGKVSIQLLRGPSTNVKPIALLADAIPNTGSFTWTPSTSLENDVTHYGLIIIVEGTGQYQYSTQFGIKNDTPVQKNPTSTASASESQPTATASEPCTTSSSSLVPISTMTTVECDCTHTSGVASPTGTGVVPTSPASSPTYSITPTPTPSSPPFNNGAGRNGVALGGAIAALAAVLAF